MVLAYFIYKIVFDDKINYEYYCDNCIYNRGEVGLVPIFKAYNMNAKLGIMYANTAEYSNLLFFSKRQKLLVQNPLRGPKIAANRFMHMKRS